MIKLQWRAAPVLFLLLLFPVLAQAQNAAELDALLETPALSVAGAARFVLGSVDLLPKGLSGPAAQKAAYDMALSKGWITGGPNDAITLENAAFLIMSAFDVKGGLMYSLVPGPRYAYREMLYRKLIQGRADPGMSVSGERLLRIIDKTASYAENGGAP